jgi:hypothetical protein
MQRSLFAGAAALGLSGMLLAHFAPGGTREESTRGSVGSVTVPPPPRTACGRSLRAAYRWHHLAWGAVDDECEAIEVWDSALMEWPAERALRRGLLAADRTGHLRQARAAARQAEALAESPAEQYRAALLLACLACEAGDYPAELREARRLVALAPRHPLSRLWLSHAARCLRGSRGCNAGAPGKL